MFLSYSIQEKVFKRAFNCDKMAAEAIKKNDIVELKYTGYHDKVVFDSNVEAELKKINPDANAEKLVVVVGHGMVVPGFDKAIEGKEIGKEYEISLSPKEGFGERKRELIKTIPLKVFHAKRVDPKPGMTLALDNMLVKIITVSGARVVADFNNPMAGKDVTYKFSVERRIDDEKEKCENVFNLFFRIKPDFEIKDKVIVKGPKKFEFFVTALKDKFKEIIGKELAFEEIKKEERKEEKDKTEEKEEVKS